MCQIHNQRKEFKSGTTIRPPGNSETSSNLVWDLNSHSRLVHINFGSAYRACGAIDYDGLDPIRLAGGTKVTGYLDPGTMCLNGLALESRKRCKCVNHY
ncbi:hypothetical protein TWF225_009892 [Orbilia oligospora]|nr:hypothetical protein TWF751_008790 [Orbilia oligospora]KAF3173113.1 hypothetical protein TWF225_009892 [Orbilia oligospora]KAF3267514.1 hypothetical protein TWF128_009058 [Orbilia oligospora]KAF3291711.1 hypothetical protein TWF132_006692 [Orbilia oligospora]